jgi:small multidrug resistance family-3 protein
VILTLAILIGSAILEVGGDALMRLGLTGARGWILAGAAVLTIYGIVVNQSGLDFGRLMGLYIAVFFVVSQVIAFAIFHQTPSRGTLAGGALIVAGGLVMMTR